MKAGDLFRVKSTCDPNKYMPPVYTLNPQDDFEYAFTLTHDDLGIVIDPVYWEGYTKVMVRGQVVWIVFQHSKLSIVS